MYLTLIVDVELTSDCSTGADVGLEMFVGGSSFTICGNNEVIRLELVPLFPSLLALVGIGDVEWAMLLLIIPEVVWDGDEEVKSIHCVVLTVGTSVDVKMPSAWVAGYDVVAPCWGKWVTIEWAGVLTPVASFDTVVSISWTYDGVDGAWVAKTSVVALVEFWTGEDEATGLIVVIDITVDSTPLSLIGNSVVRWSWMAGTDVVGFRFP